MLSLWSILYRRPQFKKLSDEFKKVVESEVAEEFLEVLLRLMSFVLYLDENYHRNIHNFRGKYVFKDRENNVSVRAIFGPSSILRREQLKVSEGDLKDPDITVTFKNPRALMNFLLSPKRDILGSLLRNEVTLSGNINYLYKLGFMASQLQQMVLPET